MPPLPAEVVRPLIRTRQVREFTDEPLTDEELHAITEVARWSGSSTNNQPWRFMVVRQRTMLVALAEAGHPQLRSLRTAVAGVAIVLPADPSRLIQDVYDDGRAAERMLIAANMLDLGAAIAWVRPDVLPSARQLLGLGDDRLVRTIVALGHPTPAARAPKSAPGRARIPRSESVTER
jgi:nitroreductase